MGRRRAENTVREAVEKVGGIIEACAVAKVSNRTMSRWLKAGYIPLLEPALKLAKATGIPIERFTKSRQG